VAAIDCVTWALMQRYTPEITKGLCLVGQTARYPGLPLISSLDTPAAEVQALRSALQGLFAQPAAMQALQALAIVGFAVLDAMAYERCVAMENSARALGYTELA
jgi:ABC-type phosphate/phosphonate transport system substrate-binding protein